MDGSTCSRSNPNTFRNNHHTFSLFLFVLNKKASREVGVMPSSLLVDYYDKYGSEWGAVLIGFNMLGTEYSGIAYRDTIMSPNWLPVTQDEYPGSRDYFTTNTGYLFMISGMMSYYSIDGTNFTTHRQSYAGIARTFKGADYTWTKSSWTGSRQTISKDPMDGIIIGILI